MLDMSGKYLGFALAMWHGSCPNSSPTRFKNVLSSWLTFITCKKTFLGWNGAVVLHGINNHIYSLYHLRFKRFRRDIIFDKKQGHLCQKSNGWWIQSGFSLCSKGLNRIGCVALLSMRILIQCIWLNHDTAIQYYKVS